MPLIDKEVNPTEVCYRAWCRDCGLFVSDTWDPFTAELEANEHKHRNKWHYIVMRTDTVAVNYSEGND